MFLPMKEVHYDDGVNTFFFFGGFSESRWYDWTFLCGGVFFCGATDVFFFVGKHNNIVH